MYVMAGDPFPNMSIEDFEAFFADKHTEKDLADAYALSHNKFWDVEDNTYDYEEGTPEHKAACAVTHEWGELIDKYKRRILEILAAEGVTIPENGQIKILERFMARYGYSDDNGWWIKAKNVEGSIWENGMSRRK